MACAVVPVLAVVLVQVPCCVVLVLAVVLVLVLAAPVLVGSHAAPLVLAAVLQCAGAAVGPRRPGPFRAGCRRPECWPCRQRWPTRCRRPRWPSSREQQSSRQKGSRGNKYRTRARCRRKKFFYPFGVT